MKKIDTKAEVNPMTKGYTGRLDLIILAVALAFMGIMIASQSSADVVSGRYNSIETATDHINTLSDDAAVVVAERDMNGLSVTYEQLKAAFKSDHFGIASNAPVMIDGQRYSIRALSNLSDANISSIAAYTWAPWWLVYATFNRDVAYEALAAAGFTYGALARLTDAVEDYNQALKSQ